MASTRKHMIEADEALIVIDQHNGKRFIRETAFFGEYGNFDFIRHYLLDETAEIRRANTETWVIDDITDECARHWLIDADEDGSLDYDDPAECERIMPLYVKQSKAWARWMDDLEAEKPVSMSAMYGTYSAVNGHVA